MKNIFKSLLVLGLSALLFQACTEDFPSRESSPAMDAGKMQPYFPTAGNPASVTVPLTASSYDVKVARKNSTAAATISVTKLSGDAKLSVPASVSFAAGQEEATLTIGFSGLVAFTGYPLSIELDPAFSDPYIVVAGAPEYTFRITQEDWTTIGTGTWESRALTGNAYSGRPIQRSETLNSYRIVGPYGGANSFVFKVDSENKISYAAQLSGLSSGGANLVFQMPTADQLEGAPGPRVEGNIYYFLPFGWLNNADQTEFGVCDERFVRD